MPSLAKVTRYYHTMRYLRPVQVYGRVWRKLNRPKIDLRPAPSLRSIAGTWVMPPRRPPVLLGPATFRYLNETREVRAAADWDFPAEQKISVYNLHYFDDLNAQAAALRRDWHTALIERWVQENPPAATAGWEPYPNTLRICNWIKWALAGNRLSEQAIQSLAVQARYLRQTVEWHLQGNHVLAAGKGLAFAGLFFSGPEAEQWLAEGLRILAHEFEEEILPDGGHNERSPMYHCIILEDLLDLLNLTRAYPGALPESRRKMVNEWPETALKMRRWMKAMLHPDGQIALFNDAALDVPPSAAELEEYAAHLGLSAVPEPSDGIAHLEQSGYIRMQRGPAVAFLDTALIGPDYFPGHAHADTLSFELSLFGQRVIVDTGTSTYAASPERTRQRGTAAHNTVEVNDVDSSEVWGAFRVARRARPLDLQLTAQGEEWSVSCAHDGYHRLPGRVTHRRAWRLRPDSLAIADQLIGTFQSAVARLHLHPDVPIEDRTGASRRAYTLHTGKKDVLCEFTGGTISQEPFDYHPCFGVTLPGRCLICRIEGGEAVSRLSW